jgi:hypothetical protein
MQVPSAGELLESWERGLGEPLTRRMLVLLAAACPELNVEELAALPIGQRDSQLLSLRETLFGPDLTMVAHCPACGEQLEANVRIDELRANQAPPAALDDILEMDGVIVSFRLPASLDLLAISAAPDEQAARQALLKRCVLSTCSDEGAVLDHKELPEPVWDALIERMALADPQADVRLQLTCPACDHHWLAPFHIDGFMWEEIHAWAQRTMREVHQLARAYGWREADVLGLSPTRRHIYLEMSLQ